jgi:hypothetical protein
MIALTTEGHEASLRYGCEVQRCICHGQSTVYARCPMPNELLTSSARTCSSQRKVDVEFGLVDRHDTQCRTPTIILMVALSHRVKTAAL